MKWLVALIFLFPLFAHAHVFSYNDTALATYIRGTGGLSTINKRPFGNSSGAGTSIDKSYKYDYSGELGIMYSFTPAWHIRLGAELIQHGPVSHATGTDASGNNAFSLDSSVDVFNPNVTLEYVFSTHGDWRFYALGGMGLAQVTVANDYTMTTQGTTDLGVSSYKEVLLGSGYSTHFGLGFETLFTDNVTFSVETDYRYLPINTLKYGSDVNTILNPSGVKKGDLVVNSDGSRRTIDLSGFFCAISFRFYLHFM